MKILYVHGFGSRFDPEHEKIKSLETLGTVVGVNVDYCKGFKVVMNDVFQAAQEHNVDIIVGTSMGGYMAAQVGLMAGLPFVSLNPAIEPSLSLQRWVGNFTDYTGRDHYLSQETCADYPDIVTDGFGLIIVETGDEVISASRTMSVLSASFRVESFSGGSHRFEHIDRALPLIKEHFEFAQASYGML